MIVEVNTASETLIVEDQCFLIGEKAAEVIASDFVNFKQRLVKRLGIVSKKIWKTATLSLIDSFLRNHQANKKSVITFNSNESLLTIKGVTIKASRGFKLAYSKHPTMVENKAMCFVGSVERVTNNNLLDFVATFK